MAVFDGYGRFLRVWKRMRWEKPAEEEFFAKIFCVACCGVPDTSGCLRQVKKDKMARTLFKTGGGCLTEWQNLCKKGGCPA
ncbi:hypothetical protein L0N24_08680 [Faecalibacterium prausnitzii]|uniref:hypothetical protein n=1 Tax=Faecalibacterium prausnitzii TaxID=853 RepID=UPI001EDDFE98|nr:hypothetical protein [Faecalibacterium prausnitzii]MCG4603595.1 hypothetical protein [Faecalibacterium prausnitzii]